MIVPWKSHGRKLYRSSNATVKGWKVMGRMRRQGETTGETTGCSATEAVCRSICRKGGEGAGVGHAVGSIQKSQKATKDGHGQVTFHFPSSSL